MNAISFYTSRRVGVLPLGFFITLGLALVPIVSRATSSYDSVVQLGDAIITCSDGSTVDLSSSYISKIWPTKDYSANAWGQAFQTDLNYGSGMALSKLVVPSTGVSELEFFVSSDPSNTSAAFATNTNFPNGYIAVNGYNYEVGINCLNSTHFALNINTIVYSRAVAYSSYSGDLQMLPVFMNMPLTYPPDYAGATTPPPADVDGDGLNAIREQAQDTSDYVADTDGDGLNDYTESVWNPKRDAQFCDTTTTPYTCAYPDPTTKDVYVQMDWMADDTSSFKPSDTQIGMVSDAFATQGIKFHGDAGQYGGGHEVGYSSSVPIEITDPGYPTFFDYKNANLNPDRLGIWRYMLFGNENSETPDASGATLAGSDNIFISYGHIRDDQAGFGYSDFNTAIAGTMIHELGHGLCLSQQSNAYTYQSPDCAYAGVDSGTVSSNAYPSYASSMNYADQMGMVGYSDGSNGTSVDHDDWFAVEARMDDFTHWVYSEQMPGVSTNNKSLSVGIDTKTARELKKRGLLRPGKAAWRHLQIKKNPNLINVDLRSKK